MISRGFMVMYGCGLLKVECLSLVASAVYSLHAWLSAPGRSRRMAFEGV